MLNITIQNPLPRFSMYRAKLKKGIFVLEHIWNQINIFFRYALLQQGFLIC